MAFNCIKASGGKVPRTLIGVTRIYPISYRERYKTGCKLNSLLFFEQKLGHQIYTFAVDPLILNELCISGCVTVVLL